MARLRKIPRLKTAGPKSPPGLIAHPPPAGKTQGRPLPDVSKPAMAPRGAALYHLGQKRHTGTGGPSTAPITFPGSGAEWVWFWASRKYFYAREKIATWQAPFDGGLTWQFQAQDNVDNPRAAGGSVSNFIYTVNAQDIIVRIEGSYRYTGAGPAQQARDLYLVTHASVEGDRVVRINDDQFMDDITGNKAIRLLADVLAGRVRTGQLAGGTVQAPRYADFASGISA